MPDSVKAVAITLLARTPNTRAMRKSSAAGADLQPEPRRSQKPGKAGEQHGTDHDRRNLEKLETNAQHFNFVAKRGQEVDTLEPRADHENEELLQKEADCERRNQQRRRVGAAQRPEGGTLGQQRQNDGDADRAEQHDRDRQADEAARVYATNVISSP